MHYKGLKIDSEVFLSLSIPTLSTSVAVLSTTTSKLFNAHNMASAVLHCSTAASILVLGWWALSCFHALRYLHQVRTGTIRASHPAEHGTFMLPRFMRNTVLALGGISLGLGAVLAPAQAASFYTGNTPPAQTVSLSASAPSLMGIPAATTNSATAQAQPSPFYPASDDQKDPASDKQPQLSPFFGGTDPEIVPTSSNEHVVLRGESLWDIARQQLGPHASDASTLEYTVQLHQVNRTVIGDNPDIILPGQKLLLPAA